MCACNIPVSPTETTEPITMLFEDRLVWAQKKTMYWMTDRDPHTGYIFGGGASTGFHAVMNECFAAAATPGFAARLSLSPLYVTVLNNAAMRLAGHRYLDHSSS